MNVSKDKAFVRCSCAVQRRNVNSPKPAISRSKWIENERNTVIELDKEWEDECWKHKQQRNCIFYFILFFLSILRRIGVSTAMQDCWFGHRALERFNYSSREILQPLHDSWSTHALKVTKLQSCLAFISTSLLDEALIIFSAVCSAH